MQGQLRHVSRPRHTPREYAATISGPPTSRTRSCARAHWQAHCHTCARARSLSLSLSHTPPHARGRLPRWPPASATPDISSDFVLFFFFLFFQRDKKGTHSQFYWQFYWPCPARGRAAKTPGLANATCLCCASTGFSGCARGASGRAGAAAGGGAFVLRQQMAHATTKGLVPPCLCISGDGSESRAGAALACAACLPGLRPPRHNVPNDKRTAALEILW